MGRINAGSLRERVTLLTPGTTAPDGRGGVVMTGPATQTTVYARVRPLSSTEKLQLGQTVNTQAYEITIRRTNTATAKQRLTWKGKSLNVQAVAPDEAREYEVLTCYEDGQ